MLSITTPPKPYSAIIHTLCASYLATQVLIGFVVPIPQLPQRMMMMVLSQRELAWIQAGNNTLLKVTHRWFLHE